MAEATVLFEGYVGKDGDSSRVGSTVGFIRDGDALIVVDPGLVPDHGSILEPLAGHGVGPDEVTDVILSHHHPDHTMNTALFPVARVHDHWAHYRGDVWTSRPAEGFQVSPSVRLIETPGHSPQDISTLVHADAGLVVFTHLWWFEAGPPEDPYADPGRLHADRARVLQLRPALIVPGHGPAFEPGTETVR